VIETWWEMSPTLYKIIEKSSWGFGISCINLCISLLKENRTLEEHKERG
jgi:hypothetical protein